MSKHHLGLWLLLATAFAVFAVSSAIGLPEVCGHQLKSSKIAETLLAERSHTAAADTITQTEDTVINVVSEPVPLDTAAQTILFIGDSMLEGLGPRLAAYAEENGHELYCVIWYSSTTQKWGSSHKLRKYIGRLHPTYIFVCLGANELFVRNIAENRRNYVRNILNDIDTIPYLWIGPPNWKPDTGINDLIDSETTSGSFFLSKDMSFERNSDGAHPTHNSAAEWMDSVARWMPAHSRHPIRMATPEVFSGQPKRTFVHQPNEN